jgi:hypothetical protein
MASVLKVDKLDPQSGTALEIGTSGDTVTVPTGAGLTVTDEVKTNKISPATGAAFALGDSGDTFTVPSGATIVNSGTATGFGGGKVLQILMLESGGSNTTIDSTSMQRPIDSGYYLDITPTTSGNKIICLGGMDTNTENMGVYYCIEFCVSTDGGSNWGDITNTQRAYMYLTGATRMEHNHNFLSGIHTTASTNVHRFSYQALSGVDSTQFYPNQRTSITLIEVAQ